ncbi:MAG: carbohydrate binding family 9 domain-containing protein, partial [Gemmatimonadota bacterium]
MRVLPLCMVLVVPATLAAQVPDSTRAVRAAVRGAPTPDSARPSVRAVALSQPIHLDGRLDEAVWQRAPVATGFLQNEPEEGQPATQRTEVRFAYDGEALYVGARMYDDGGAEGVTTRLVRRDATFSSDFLELIFDTQHDHLGRTVFAVNPSGVKQDAYGPGGTGPDESWDPVWEVATAIDSLCWTAELRIPFSQL